jgi:hypothetical protein
MGRQGFLYPLTLLLDKDMKIVESWIGATRPGELDKSINRLWVSKK